MKVSLSTGSLYFYPLRFSFALAKRAGFDGVELVMDPEVRLRGAAYVRELSARYEVPVLSLHPPLLGLGQGGALSSLPAMVELAQESGCGVLVTHLPKTQRLETAEGRLYLQTLAGAQRQAGELDVKVTVENPPFFPDRTSYLLKEIVPLYRFAEEQGLSLTLDTSHAASWGWDVLETYEVFKDRLANVHLSDMREGRPLIDHAFLHTHRLHHQLPGTGTLPLQDLLARMAGDGYQGTVTLEVSPLVLRLWWPPYARRALAQCVAFARA